MAFAANKLNASLPLGHPQILYRKQHIDCQEYKKRNPDDQSINEILAPGFIPNKGKRHAGQHEEGQPIEKK